MQRLKEEFLNKLETVVSLSGKDVLEIGCGDGVKSAAIAARCKILSGIDPDPEEIKVAQEKNIPNASFRVGVGEKLEFPAESFDAVIFTLSLHYIPKDKMTAALDEAARVVRKSGYITFLEPTEDGPLFDAEIKFDAGDGDEREAEGAAYQAMMSYRKFKLVKEMNDETIFKFDSLDDFFETMTPRKNTEEVEAFLKAHKYALRVGRRINVFQLA
jgi:ubiquinone/menaquinone biosynthesis C-methylase UbiE